MSIPEVQDQVYYWVLKIIYVFKYTLKSTINTVVIYKYYRFLTEFHNQ